MSQMKAQVDKLLTNVSNGLFVQGCVAEQILPGVKSAQYSGLLGKYGRNALRIENTVAGGRGKYRRVETTTYSTQQFVIEGHGLEGFVTREDYANKVLPFDAEADETTGLASVLILEKEFGLASALRSTSVMTNNQTLSGTSQFNDYTNSNPVGVMQAARASIIGSAGVAPNKAIMDILVFEKLRYHPGFLAALGYTFARPGGLKGEELAAVLGVEEVLIAQARYNDAKEGQPDTLVPIWGKDIVFCYAPDEAAVRQQSLGYIFTLDGTEPRKVYKQPNFNPPGSTSILCEDLYDIVLSDITCGYLIKNAIA